MAYCYLKGRDFLIPWDIFVPTNANSSNRYYGNIANIKELILLFKKRSLLIEVSNEPISADKKNTYYKIERRNAINVFLLNKDPLKSER